MIEETLIASIGTVGFPIVAFFLMYQMTNDTIRKNTEAIQELREAIISKKD
jgi:hypothetical protein